MYHTIIEPRVSETDAVGHINNTTVPIWLEAGRIKIFKLFTPDLSFDNWRMIIVNMNIDYVGELYFGENADVYTWVKKIGNSSFILYEEIHQNEKLCVKGTAAYVNFNNKLKKSQPIPDEIKRELEKHYYEDGQ